MVGIPTSTWIAAVLIFAAVSFGVVALAAFIEWVRNVRRRKAVVHQLDSVVREGFDTVAGASPSLLRRSAKGDPAWVLALSARVPTLKDLDYRLKQAELTWSVQTFLLLTAGLAVAFGLFALVLTNRMAFAVPLAGLGAAFPRFYVSRKATKRLRAFEEQLPDAIDLMGRAIRAGHPLSAGLKMVADEMNPPINGEFLRVFEEQRFGLPFEDALLSMVDRIQSVDTRILVTAILIQREVGGNLAEILDKLASTIRARFTFKRQLRVYTAQGRMSGYVLAFLPIIVGFVIFLLNRDYTMTLFEEPAGRLMVVAAAFLQIMGFLWIRKIVDIEF